MNLRSKKIWLFLALLVTVAAAVAVTRLASSREPAQFVTLSDGVTYRFVGVTWGTNHSDLTDQRLVARVIDHLPSRFADYIHTKLGARLHLKPLNHTSGPALYIWLKPETTNAPAAGTTGTITWAYAMLADANGTEAGGEAVESLGTGSTGISFVFGFLPRRNRVLECHFYPHQSGWISSGPGWSSSYGTGSGPAIPVPQPQLGRVRFPNPAYGRHPQWQPEPLTAIKHFGDVEVRLSNCVTGISIARGTDPLTGKYTNLYRAPAPGEAAVTRFDLEITSPRGTNERWTAQSTVLSDATGNSLTNSHVFTQEGTFWPDERAVRLHVELKRTSGFPAADLITFSNLPVPAPNATNGTALTNLFYGMPIIARNYSTEQLRRRPGIGSNRMGLTPGPCRVELELPPFPPGMVVDFVDFVADTGETLRYQSGSDSGQFPWRSFTSMPAGARSLTVTIAVQKTRTVDFFMKPVTPK